MPNLNEENQNYKELVDQAEHSLKKEYLGLFLSNRVIEGIKIFIKHSFETLIQESPSFANKIENFEFSRSIDDLYASKKIDKSVFMKI